MKPQEVYLAPGEWAFGDRALSIRTLLGSCVAMVLWHPVRLLGGMCHFLLPGRNGEHRELDGRWANEAMALLLAEVNRAGTRPAEYHLKLVGGGATLELEGAADSRVGERNIRAARELARQHGFGIQGEQVGGVGHRVVVFEVATGDVWVKHVEPPRRGAR